MGFLDALLGRTKPVQANLDRLFGLPGARITLEASEGLVPTGEAGVCFKPSAGQAFDATEREITGMLSGGDGVAGVSAKLGEEADEYGYRWVVLGAADFDTLVTQAHFVNSTLQDHGYGPQLLCSVFGFVPASPPGSSTPGGPASTYLVYLYKRGSFYPFVPTGGERRDNEAELRLKVVLGDDLAIEADLDRWFPLWRLPVR
ncbi:MAG: PspA-associated protein PspAB [Acidimicrobiales bacterium]